MGWGLTGEVGGRRDQGKMMYIEYLDEILKNRIKHVFEKTDFFKANWKAMMTEKLDKPKPTTLVS